MHSRPLQDRCLFFFSSLPGKPGEHLPGFGSNERIHTRESIKVVYRCLFIGWSDEQHRSTDTQGREIRHDQGA